MKIPMIAAELREHAPFTAFGTVTGIVIMAVFIQYFTIHTEYMLGVSGEKIFAGNDPRETALYTVVGERINYGI